MNPASRDTAVITPVDFDPFADHRPADGLPLTEPQREIWAATQMGDDASRAYNMCHVLVLRGALSHESMQNALQQLVERHEALRVFIDAEGERQNISPSAAVALPVADLSHLTASERAAELARVVDEEMQNTFDFGRAPLLRARLIREASDLHRLVITKHHIVCDGWSWALMLKDLGRCYAADRQGLRPRLAPHASYSEYIARVTEGGAESQAKEDEDYWACQYADGAPVLDLPLDRPRPKLKTYSGAARTLHLDETLSRAIKAAGARHGCTLFVTLLAALQALFARLSAQDDFVLGIPMADQALLDNPHLIGHCVNMIPLRCRPDPEASFAAHLAQVREQFLEAQSHQQLTFGRLVQRLNVPRDPARTPLVSATFNIDRVASTHDFGDLTLEAVESPPKRFVNFEYSLNVNDNGRDLVVVCEYNTDLYAGDTIERWLGHYRVLLESIAADTGQRIDELPLLTPAEKDRLVHEWNRTEVRHDAGTSLLHGLFEAQAARTPDAVAVVDGEARLSYRELDERANRLAHYLRNRGVAADILVPICVERAIDMVIGLLGILKAGGAYLPVDPELPAQRIGYMLEDARAPVILTQAHLLTRLPAIAGHAVRLDADGDEIARESATRPQSGVREHHLAYVIYTSGSTGRPKGVMIPHAAICNHMNWMQRVHPLGPADRVLQKTGFGFDASVWEFFAPLMAGAQLVMARPGGQLDPVYLAETILSHGITRLQLVPSQLRLLLEEPVFWNCAPPLQDVFCGGEPLTPALCAEFYRRLPHATLHNLYGPTETTIDATAWTCERAAIPHAIPIGCPVDNVRAYIVNTRMQLAPVGVPGELLIGGAGLARGYLKREALTAEMFVVDPFCADDSARVYRTGDLARRLPDGTIQYLGRIDQQLKIRGYRIEPGEIEAALLQHAAVRHASVVAHADAAGDQRLAAYLVAANGNSELADQLRNDLRRTMPEYMVPAYFVFLDALPLTRNGKLDRRALPAPGVETRPARQASAPPRSEPEKMVAHLFEEVLRRSHIAIHDNFFDLGGDSLMAARLMARLRGASGLDLRLRDLFERPTVAGLAEAIDALSWLAKSGAPPGSEAERERIEL